jgi:hypothetical protein
MGNDIFVEKMAMKSFIYMTDAKERVNVAKNVYSLYTNYEVRDKNSVVSGVCKAL